MNYLHVVSCNSYAPNIHFFIVWLHHPNLRRHINGSPTGCVKFHISKNLAYSEIRQLEQCIRSICAKQNILRLYVPVHYSHLVAISDSIDQHSHMMSIYLYLYLTSDSVRRLRVLIWS